MHTTSHQAIGVVMPSLAMEIQWNTARQLPHSFSRDPEAQLAVEGYWERILSMSSLWQFAGSN
jgi:hypothetical protein